MNSTFGVKLDVNDGEVREQTTVGIQLTHTKLTDDSILLLLDCEGSNSGEREDDDGDAEAG